MGQPNSIVARGDAHLRKAGDARRVRVRRMTHAILPVHCLDISILGAMLARGR